MTEERLSFDKVPEIYDRVRPLYPEALFDELLAYLEERSTVSEPKVLEIGPGTGQATASLLERGAHVTSVEIGPQLARFLRRKFADEPRLDVINCSFEEADLPKEAYDLVVSATAFHWVDADVRYVKSHDLLRGGGTLAIISTNQIASDADRGYFDRTFPIYLKYRPDEQRSETPGEDVTPSEHGEMIASGLFGDVTLRRYRWDQTYATAAYADLVRSYGGTQMMEPPAAEALIAELCEVIEREYGGSVTRPLVITLTLGRKQL